MYSFIMYIMYNYQKSKGSSDAFARFNASMITAFSIYIQLMLILVILSKTHFAVPKSFLRNNFEVVAMMVLLYMTVWRVFTRARINDNITKPKYTPTNFRKLMVFLIIAGSIFLFGFILNHF